MNKATCSETDCSRAATVRGLCEPHYRVALSAGRIPRVKNLERTCGVIGCDRPYSAGGYCKRHYERARLNGDPLIVRTRGTKPGTLSPERHHRWAGGAISYQGMHLRMRRWFGSARRRMCVDCGGPALHWSYTYADPNELMGELNGTVLRYSADPLYYEPRCGVCHVRFDAAHAFWTAEGRVYDLDPVL